jgi:hypothetical protein
MLETPQIEEVRIDALLFHKNGVVIDNAQTDLESFWVSLGPGVGYAMFTKVPGTEDRHLLQQLLLGHCPAPSPLVSVPGVLWRRLAAIEAHQAIASYRRDTAARNAKRFGDSKGVGSNG